jgi:hypothetical protein
VRVWVAQARMVLRWCYGWKQTGSMWSGRRGRDWTNAARPIRPTHPCRLPARRGRPQACSVLRPRAATAALRGESQEEEPIHRLRALRPRAALALSSFDGLNHDVKLAKGHYFALGYLIEQSVAALMVNDCQMAA